MAKDSENATVRLMCVVFQYQ